MSFRNCRLISINSWGNITDKGLLSFSKGFPKLKSLQSLNLSLPAYKIKGKGLGNVGEGLKSLSWLKSFHLDFSSCQKDRTDEGIKMFCEGLKSLSSLESIKLRFHSNQNIKDECLSNIGEGLKSLSCLKYLDFDFDG